MPKRSAPRAGNARWSHGRLLAGLVLIFRRHLPCVGLEVIGSESKVDRDGDVLVIEDILEGFGRVPVSVDFSPVSEHMFIAFKEGEVRVYPDGGDTMFAPDFTPCLDMDDEVYANNDLGLLNFRLHPDWPATPYAFMIHTHDPGYEDECFEVTEWCEKDHRLTRILVEYDETTGDVTCGEIVILISDWCTGSNHHGGGGIAFLSGGDMIFSVGDMSKADQRDVGDQEENTCFDEDVPLPQGNFRAQRDGFNEGKVFRIPSDTLLKDPPSGGGVDEGFLVRDEDFFMEGKGFRNPFRLTVNAETGDVLVTDVGLNTFESIKLIPDPQTNSANGSRSVNHGWPCMEGDAWIPPYTNLWLVDHESDICDPVRGTTNALPDEIDYDEVKTQALAGELDWVPPVFTYNDYLDSEYPTICASTQQAVTAIYFYTASYLPSRYHNRVFVGDYAKSCVFYFDTDEDTGEVDWSAPHVLFESRAIVDFNADPKTGILYMIDAQFSILLRMTVNGTASSTSSSSSSSSSGPSVSLEADVAVGMVPLEIVLDALISSESGDIAAVEWDCEGDGVFEAEIDWSSQTSSTGTEAMVTHMCNYTVAGRYEATVRVTDADDASAVESLTIIASAEADGSGLTPAPVLVATPEPSPMPSIAATIEPTPLFWSPTPSPVAPPVGEALSSPPELVWDWDDDTGVFSGALDFGVVTMENFWGNTTTRGYNGGIPGPTIRMEACQTYHLTLTNMLEEPNPTGPMNTLRDPNATNVHTHGLHISGESPADDVLFVVLGPGEAHTYEYLIPCDHAGGTFWYHPHHHGATSLQLGGGAMGVLIVEDRPEVQDIPDQIHNMPELIIAIQEMDPSKTGADSLASGDTLYNTTATTRYYLLNGEVFPSIHLESGNWTRLRMSFAGHGDNHAIGIEDPQGYCEMALLAKDGVYLSEVPREVSKLFFTPASRVDIALRCSHAEDFLLEIENAEAPGDTTAIGVLVVQDATPAADAALESWEPCRPYYLEDLVGLNFTETDTLQLTVRDSIGGTPYTGPHDILLNMTVDEVQQWNIQESEIHPFHMHVNHMQFLRVDGPRLVDGWNVPGDWVDTVSTELAVVRFRTERFGGHVVMHCHVNTHGDTGIMAVAIVEDGEGPNENPSARAPGTCGVEGIAGYGYDADGSTAVSAVTPSPSGSSQGPAAGEDTISPTTNPTDLLVDVGDSVNGGGSIGSAKDSWWVAAAGGAGVGLGILTFAAFLFFRLERRQGAQGTKVTGEDKVAHELGETKTEPT